MDRRILIIRRWLLLLAAVLVAACCPASWFLIAPCLVLTPIVWIRNGKVLIHPDGPPWKIAVGDSEDFTCACCATCVLCSGSVPAEYQVDISGMINGGGTCSDCPDFDGSYFLPFHDAGAFACNWVMTLDPEICGYNNVDFSIANTGFDKHFKVNLGTTVFKDFWFGSTVDCELSAKDLPLDVNGTDCDASVATCTVTAL